MRTHLDLFSGVGGFALASNWAGYDTIGFCEIDPYCQRVLRKHWPNGPIWADVRTLTGATVRAAVDANRGGELRIPEHGGTRSGELVSLITAGYPCQPFSLAGKRLGAEDDRHLWPEVKRLLAELRPARFLGENVAGHINMGLDDVLSDLEEIGYTARAVVIPACAVGAPHRRDRVWILAHADREPERRPALEADTGRDRGASRVEPEFGGDRLTVGESASHVADAGHAERGASDATGHHVNGYDTGDGGRLAPDRTGWRHEGDEAEQRVGESHDGLPGWMARSGLMDVRWDCDPMRSFGPDWEDGVPRVVATEKDRVHRLKALGNAIVPAVAYQILLAMDTEVAA